MSKTNKKNVLLKKNPYKRLNKFVNMQNELQSFVIQTKKNIKLKKNIKTILKNVQVRALFKPTT